MSLASGSGAKLGHRRYHDVRPRGASTSDIFKGMKKWNGSQRKNHLRKMWLRCAGAGMWFLFQYKDSRSLGSHFVRSVERPLLIDAKLAAGR